MFVDSGGLTDLERLREARATLLDEAMPYDHGNWDHCTCGHIYLAAVGQVGLDGALTDGDTPMPSVYQQTIRHIATMLGWRHTLDLESPSWYVSSAVMRHALRRDGGSAASASLVLREDAVAIIDRAIAEIEQEQRRAMLLVAA